jgi:AcrR family transcriptional regulator
MTENIKANPVHAPAKLENPGVRALAKKASQDKIVMAARRLFTEHGYDTATLRQIAKAAGLGLATLFNHIQDKRDLIYLIFDEEVTLVAERSEAAVRPWQTFVEKILTISSFYFQMFSVEPVLSRILLSEVLQQSPGPHLERHLLIRGRLIDKFESLAKQAQASGELKPELDARVIARSIQFAFTGASRWWIMEPVTDWRSGQRYFEEIVGLLADGFNQPSGKQTATVSSPKKKKLVAAQKE